MVQCMLAMIRVKEGRLFNPSIHGARHAHDEVSMLGPVDTTSQGPQPGKPGPLPNGWDPSGGPPGPVPPKQVSSSATTAMVLAVLGMFCLGPIGGIAAFILGLVALKEIKDSRGAQGGTALAGVAVGLGALSTLAFTGGIVAAVWMAATSPAPPPTISPTVYVPPSPVPTTTPSPTVPKKVTGPGNEVASRDTTTTELKLAGTTVVDVGSDVSSLDSELRTQRAKAARNGEKLLLETTSADCRPCFGVAAALGDKKMQKALEGVRLVRVDVLEFSDELRAAGIPHEAIPGFFLLGVDMSPVDGIHGGEWDDDTADNIAPVLSAFVRGKLTHRREPWGAQRREPTGGTEL